MLNRFYIQDVTYWGIASRDTFQSITFSAPAVFKGRWEDKNQEVITHSGETFVSRSAVHYPQTLNVEIDGYLFNGVSGASDPRAVVGAYQVKTLSSHPDLRNLETVKVALL